jgi:hypothetical protein
MTSPTPVPSDFEEGYFPVRDGNWLARGQAPNIEIAKIRTIYREDDQFIVDLLFYDNEGNRLGRISPNEPFEIDGKIYHGPRSFEPCCSLEGWYRIKKPEFPLTPIWVTGNDGWRRMSYPIIKRDWGNYSKRKQGITEITVANMTVNYDPELERRARRYAAEILRDIARETGIEALRERANQLENEVE